MLKLARESSYRPGRSPEHPVEVARTQLEVEVGDVKVDAVGQRPEVDVGQKPEVVVHQSVLGAP